MNQFYHKRDSEEILSHDQHGYRPEIVNSSFVVQGHRHDEDRYWNWT